MREMGTQQIDVENVHLVNLLVTTVKNSISIDHEAFLGRSQGALAVNN